MVSRVQQVMCFFTAGFAQKFSVEFLDIRVFMGETQRFAFVFRVDTLHAFFQQVSLYESPVDPVF